MTRTNVTRAAAGATFAIALAIAVAGAPTARAATAGPCTGTSGVTVVVDASALGGDVVVRCAPGPVSDGFDALAQAGFEVTQPLRTGGFVCRIDGRPGPEAEACVDTPPPTAYWSYWTAPRGGSWTYSSFGAAARRPAAGSVEGWSFSRAETASEAPPPSVRPPAPTPVAPSTSAPPAGERAPSPPTASIQRPAVAGVTTTRPATAAPTTPGAVASSTIPVDPDDGGAVPGETTSSAAPPATAAPDPPERADAAPVADRRTRREADAGSPVPTAVGLVLLVAFAGTAAAIAARRRTSTPIP